jgi:hypothetical protein
VITGIKLGCCEPSREEGLDGGSARFIYISTRSSWEGGLLGGFPPDKKTGLTGLVLFIYKVDCCLRCPLVPPQQNNLVQPDPPRRRRESLIGRYEVSFISGTRLPARKANPLGCTQGVPLSVLAAPFIVPTGSWFY